MENDSKTILPGAKLPLLFAHRGCSHRAPENTLAAFRKTLELGVPGVEIDIHRSADGELVVTHDFSLKRVSGLDAEVEACRYGDIKSLDVGAWFSDEFAGEHIPLLDEVVELLGDRVYYDIEIKERRKKPTGLVETLLRKIDMWGLSENCILSSFNPYPIKEIHRRAPQMATALIYTNRKKLPLLLRGGGGRFYARPNVLKPDKKDVGPLSLLLMKRIEGYPLIPWTVDEPREAERLLELGVDGIISNVPELLLETVSQLRG